jgi:anti-sigma28 factor (negative regulator of flagellin synthesis)
MGKDDTTKKDAAETDKESGGDEKEASGSDEVELEATKTKKGEPDDNLKRRAEWFQKRTGGA